MFAIKKVQAHYNLEHLVPDFKPLPSHENATFMMYTQNDNGITKKITIWH